MLVTLALLLALSPPGAVHAQSLPPWQAGPGATGDSTIQGVVDTPASGATLPTNGLIKISGWVVDTSAQGWSGIDDVRVFVGTSMDTGTFISHPVVGQSRPDVASTLGNPFFLNAGWSGVLDTGGLTPGQDLLGVYAHTPGNGWWFTAFTVSVGSTTAGGLPKLQVTAPLPDQQVSDRLPYFRVTGTVTDPVHGPNAIDYVEVWLNGEQGSDTGKLLGVADLDTRSGAWFVDFNPANYPQIASNLYVYAHSAVTGKRTLVVVHFTIVDRPLT